LGSFSVDRFFLKKSTLTREGPIYEDLAEFLLQHPG
jgi:2'-5' RNA ligase